MPQMLLRDREEEIARLHDRKPTYYFMDPFFIPLAKTKNWKNPESYVKLHNFYCDYGSAEVGPTINKVDFIFIPTCVEENHWILFVFSVKTWGVVILDPLYDDSSYPEEEEIVVRIHLMHPLMSLLNMFSSMFTICTDLIKHISDGDVARVD